MSASHSIMLKVNIDTQGKVDVWVRSCPASHYVALLKERLRGNELTST